MKRVAQVAELGYVRALVSVLLVGLALLTKQAIDNINFMYLY